MVLVSYHMLTIDCISDICQILNVVVVYVQLVSVVVVYICSTTDCGGGICLTTDCGTYMYMLTTICECGINMLSIDCGVSSIIMLSMLSVWWWWWYMLDYCNMYFI